MNREEFNKLSIEDQVTYFNKKIKEMGSSSAASRDIGYKDESTIRKRFRSKGYKMNSDKSEYISFNQSDTKIINKHDDSTNNESETLVKEDKKYIEDMKDLLVVKDDILKIVNLYKNNKIACTSTDKIKIDTNRIGNEKALTKGLKIYPSLLNEFKKFCKEHKEYKIQDMLAMSMVEYMENHK